MTVYRLDYEVFNAKFDIESHSITTNSLQEFLLICDLADSNEWVTHTEYYKNDEKFDIDEVIF